MHEPTTQWDVIYHHFLDRREMLLHDVPQRPQASQVARPATANVASLPTHTDDSELDFTSEDMSTADLLIMQSSFDSECLISWDNIGLLSCHVIWLSGCVFHYDQPTNFTCSQCSHFLCFQPSPHLETQELDLHSSELLSWPSTNLLMSLI